MSLDGLRNIARYVKRSQREISASAPRAACERARDVRDGFQYQIEFRGSLIFNLLASTLTIYHRYTGDPPTIVKSFQNFPSYYNRGYFPWKL